MSEALIIIPTYNEKENLSALSQQVLDALPCADLLVVDDNSPDGTGKLADELALSNPRVHVLHREGKLGLGTAYIAGFRYALKNGYTFIFEMDADFSHDPVYLSALLSAARDGAGVAIGSRRVPGGGTQNWGFWRQVISAGGSLYARTILGLDVRDLTSGFKCFRREVLETVDLSAVRSNGYSFQIEMTYRAVRKGFSIAEVPIVFVDRRAGTSKMSGKIFAEAMGMVWHLRFASGL